MIAVAIVRVVEEDQVAPRRHATPVQAAVSPDVPVDGLHPVVARQRFRVQVDSSGGVGGADEGGTVDASPSAALAQSFPGRGQRAVHRVDGRLGSGRPGKESLRLDGRRERRLRHGHGHGNGCDLGSGRLSLFGMRHRAGCRQGEASPHGDSKEVVPTQWSHRRRRRCRGSASTVAVATGFARGRLRATWEWDSTHPAVDVPPAPRATVRRCLRERCR